VLVALAVIAAIWWPEFALWYVAPKQPSAEVVAKLRSVPARDVLVETGRMDLKPPFRQPSNGEIVELAEAVGRGTLRIPGFPDEQITPVFTPANLYKGSYRSMLLAASLVDVDFLIEAYRLTGQEKYFQLAQKSILAFAHFENSRLMDTGFLWNDHAIAARIPVLVKFWAAYREREDFDLKTAQSVLKLVSRSGLLLDKPEHYAWRTGHGIVSNIALLQIGVAFPFLEESKQFVQTAQTRLAGHLPYYVNREGVTLLHSASYTVGGVVGLGKAMRLYTLAGIPIAPDWWERAQKAEDFLALLRRPDGTLPMFGDTESYADWLLSPQHTRRNDDGSAVPLLPPGPAVHRGGVGLYPEAGYAVWWYPRLLGDLAALSQTVAVWSNYPGLGHKHADELSVLIWARGRNWFTNVGYWPYGMAGRKQSESWTGSNAPHLRGEAALSSRSARMTAQGAGEEVFYLEMERQGPEGFSAKREVVQVGPATWIVFDQFADTVAREVETHWTLYPDLKVVPGSVAGSFTIGADHSADTMRCAFQASGGGNVDRLAGSAEPFGGWVVIGQTPTPANTIRVRSASQQGWQLTVCSLSERGRVIDDALVATLSGVQGADRWSVQVADGTGHQPPLSVTRSGNQLSVRTSTTPVSQMKLEVLASPDPKADIAPVLAAFDTMTANSERRVPLIPYRVKWSYALLGLLLVQELLLYATHRRRPRLAIAVRVASVAAWVVAGIWLTQVYLVAR
jgi:hypothetical protein